MKDFVAAGRNLSQLINSTTTTTAATTLSSTMHVMEEELRMCENLADFSKSYDSMHGYMCLAICIFGAVANLLNIVVLTRKEMNESPINRILTGMYQMFTTAYHFRGNWYAFTKALHRRCRKKRQP